MTLATLMRPFPISWREHGLALAALIESFQMSLAGPVRGWISATLVGGDPMWVYADTQGIAGSKINDELTFTLWRLFRWTAIGARLIETRRADALLVG